MIGRWRVKVFSAAGDGFGAAFASHTDAIRAAIDALIVAAALAFLRGDASHASRLLAVEHESLWAGDPCSWALYIHVRDRVRNSLTREQATRCKAEAASFTVDTALAAELGDAWPLEP